jgi:hypothetical protein
MNSIHNKKGTQWEMILQLCAKKSFFWIVVDSFVRKGIAAIGSTRVSRVMA